MKSSLLLALSAGAALCAIAALSSVAMAQTGPELDGKPTGIGDWTVRCYKVASPSPCEMYEELDDKNSRQRVLGMSIAYSPSNDRHLIQIAVPLGVSIPKGLVVQADSFTSPALHYRRCDRLGCYVEMVFDNSFIASLSKAGPKAIVKIVGDNGKDFDINLSLDGFAGAHDSMAEQAKQKAKNPPPAAPNVINGAAPQ
jgi:invasion protein IalB